MPPPLVSINNRVAAAGAIKGEDAWVEGCSIDAPLTLSGNNVLVGVDIDRPLELRPGACLDVIPGRGRAGKPVHFVRCYHVDDVSSRTSVPTLCGWPLDCWLAAAGVGPEAVWDEAAAPANRGLWNARLFPAEAKADGCDGWLWMFDPAAASHEQFREWLSADRYSMEEMAAMTDQEAFHRRRGIFRGLEILGSLRRCFRPDSGFSAADLAYVLAQAPEPARCFADVLAEARRHWDAPLADAEGAFVYSRIIHSLGSAVAALAEDPGVPLGELLKTHRVGPAVPAATPAPSADRRDPSEPPAAGTAGPTGSEIAGDRSPLPVGEGQGEGDDGRRRPVFHGRGPLMPSPPTPLPKGEGTTPGELLTKPGNAAMPVGQWADRARTLAFEFLRRRIVASGEPVCPRPANALRSDEIVWGRAPARIDLTGGWTDTPPFALEHGGCVLNAAVELNGQPPIQVYARVTPERIIRCRSIDVGSQVEIGRWDDLLDYAQPSSHFSLVKAALALAGFSPAAEGVAAGETLESLLDRFGGGLEVTTLAAIPKGSGLGTSSIMGAVLTAVIHRVVGRSLTPDALFHAVLRLEQALTTGGGWQDQIGGSVGGLKLITTRPGLVPQATIRYVPADILGPATNDGQTLLYYTGITRLAKNILEEVVGRYLDRDRAVVATLANLRSLAQAMTEAVARKDLPEFGRMIAAAWQLNKQMDPHSTTPEIEDLLARVGPHVFGAKLLGAGGGGFLLMVARSRRDAEQIRALLARSPLNSRSRFFAFDIAAAGLAVSVC